MLRQLSIKTRVLLITAILTAMLAGTTLYMTAKLADNSRAVARTADLAQLVNTPIKSVPRSANTAIGSPTLP